MSTVLLVDATSIFAFQQYLKKTEAPTQAPINYAALKEALERRVTSANGERRGTRTRTEALAQVFDPMVAFVAINPEHEGQQRFCTFLRNQGFVVDETDYRDAYILPAVLVPEKMVNYQRLSTRITYLLGMLAQKRDKREAPPVVVVTDAFDVYYPMLDYVRHRDGQATLAFFRRGLEDRWQRAGLFEDASPIKFWDLGPNAKDVLGVDLGSSIERAPEVTGLGQLRF